MIDNPWEEFYQMLVNKIKRYENILWGIVIIIMFVMGLILLYLNLRKL